MIDQSLSFFKSVVPHKELVQVVPILDDTDNVLQYDIQYNGIELGSYGIRSCDFLEWIYGTAIAEPRLTLAIKQHELSSKKDKKGKTR
jgi:hypothetical protein